MITIEKKTIIIFIKLYTAFKLDLNVPWDLKIAPLHQVWLLNQVLLNQEKLILKKPIKFWDLGIMVVKPEMLLKQVPIRQ